MALDLDVGPEPSSGDLVDADLHRGDQVMIESDQLVPETLHGDDRPARVRRPLSDGPAITHDPRALRVPPAP